MKTTLKVVLATAAMVLAASAASASPVTSIAALGPDDTIFWGQLGPSLTSLTGPQSVTSTGGINVTVTSAGNVFERRDQGNGWNGNFGAGEQLLWDKGTGPDITLTFGTPVAGVGAQIQANIHGAYTAEITLSNGNIFTQSGVASGAGDNSAVFLGGLDAFTDITSIRFDLTSAFSAKNDFAIGRVYLKTTGTAPPPATGVPEPVTLSLFGAGVAGVAMLRRRRKHRAA